MVEINTPKGPFAYRTRWFGDPPRPSSSFSFLAHIQSSGGGPVAGFVRAPFLTRVVGLECDDDALVGSFRRTTRHDLQRAARDGIATRGGRDTQPFRHFFNRFARIKGVGLLTADHLDAVGTRLWITEAAHDGEVLAMHSYLVDHESGRARLLHAAPRVVDEQIDRSQLVGRANRLLHFHDMRFFRGVGCTAYDFGGHADAARDGDLTAINRFKEGFGGRIVKEWNYCSVPLLVARKAYQIAFSRRLS